MTTIAEYFDLSIPKPNEKLTTELIASDIYLGIEIEMEGVTLPQNTGLDYWRRVTDASLRDGGYEFKFLEPYAGKAIINAIVELYDIFINPGASYIFNERCSTHIHLDIRDLDMDEFKHMILNLIVMEPYLYCYMVDPIRRNNNFCVPWYMAPSRYATFAEYLFDPYAMRMDTLFRVLSQTFSKYDGINLSSIETFGTIEFRFFPGTLDMMRLINFINLVLSFKLAAKRKLQPELAPKDISTNNIQSTFINYMRSLFDKYESCYGVIPTPSDGVIDHCASVYAISQLQHKSLIRRYSQLSSTSEGIVQRAIKSKTLNNSSPSQTIHSDDDVGF